MEYDREPAALDLSDDLSVACDAVTEETSPGPVRRGMLIGVSVVVGMAIGMGGYLFFSAGKKQDPPQKQVAKVIPDPVSIVPEVPGAHAGKQKVVPEIAVQTELSAAQPAGAEQEPSGKETVVAELPADAYYVQAGVFGSRDNADALAKKIREKGFASSVTKVEGTGGKSLYRVIAGTAADRSKAIEISWSLRSKGFTTIVRRQ